MNVFEDSSSDNQLSIIIESDSDFDSDSESIPNTGPRSNVSFKNSRTKYKKILTPTNTNTPKNTTLTISKNSVIPHAKNSYHRYEAYKELDDESKRIHIYDTLKFIQSNTYDDIDAAVRDISELLLKALYFPMDIELDGVEEFTTDSENRYKALYSGFRTIVTYGYDLGDYPIGMHLKPTPKKFEMLGRDSSDYRCPMWQRSIYKYNWSLYIINKLIKEKQFWDSFLSEEAFEPFSILCDGSLYFHRKELEELMVLYRAGKEIVLKSNLSSKGKSLHGSKVPKSLRVSQGTKIRGVSKSLGGSKSLEVATVQDKSNHPKFKLKPYTKIFPRFQNRLYGSFPNYIGKWDLSFVLQFISGANIDEIFELKVDMLSTCDDTVFFSMPNSAIVFDFDRESHSLAPGLLLGKAILPHLKSSMTASELTELTKLSICNPKRRGDGVRFYLKAFRESFEGKKYTDGNGELFSLEKGVDSIGDLHDSLIPEKENNEVIANQLQPLLKSVPKRMERFPCPVKKRNCNYMINTVLKECVKGTKGATPIPWKLWAFPHYPRVSFGSDTRLVKALDFVVQGFFVHSLTMSPMNREFLYSKYIRDDVLIHVFHASIEKWYTYIEGFKN